MDTRDRKKIYEKLKFLTALHVAKERENSTIEMADKRVWQKMGNTIFENGTVVIEYKYFTYDG